jgi:uncharacterized protein YndB with AHSA1/START domain
MTQAFLYSVEREYPVGIDRMWQAWTTTSELETWYHGTEHSCVKGATTSELRIGGLWTVAIDVPQFNFVAYFYGQYQAIETNRQLKHTLHYTQSADEFALRDMSTPSHLIVIDLEDRGASSWARFSQFGELPEGDAEQAQAGMESYFDSLGIFFNSK